MYFSEQPKLKFALLIYVKIVVSVDQGSTAQKVNIPFISLVLSFHPNPFVRITEALLGEVTATKRQRVYLALDALLDEGKALRRSAPAGAASRQHLWFKR